MPVELNKTIAEASLDNLHDIIIPDAIGFFPLAPGVYIVILLFLALLFHFVLQGYKKYQHSQYRRDALKELDLYSANSKENTLALLLLAKRVGIASYGRKQIAKYSGDSWWDFMQKHSKVQVSAEQRANIAQCLYDGSSIDDPSLHSEVHALVTLWIKTHKVEKDV